MQKVRFAITCALLLCSGVLCAQPYENMVMRGRGGKELFFSDSLNIYSLYRSYPAPQAGPSPAPSGYKAVYLTSYGRHGSRKLHRADYTSTVLAVLSAADSSASLTPLGSEIMYKVSEIDKDCRLSIGELTTEGVRQHKELAERLYRYYPSIFASRRAAVRCYSTVIQRTMMSMAAAGETLLKLNPHLDLQSLASGEFTYLNARYADPFALQPHKPFDDFLRKYFDFAPVLGKLFVEGAPAISDTAAFVRCLYLDAAIVPCLDISGLTPFARELFSPEDLFTLAQAMNYMIYVRNSSSPLNCGEAPASQKPLLSDIISKADAALSSDCPSADLRFGHDSYLIPLVALMGVDGYDKSETDPLKVADVFQDYSIAPMAGNLQLVYFRNRSGDVIVKILLNEREATLPVPTDIFPYYHWDDLRIFLTNKL